MANSKTQTLNLSAKEFDGAAANGGKLVKKMSMVTKGTEIYIELTACEVNIRRTSLHLQQQQKLQVTDAHKAESY